MAIKRGLINLSFSVSNWKTTLLLNSYYPSKLVQFLGLPCIRSFGYVHLLFPRVSTTPRRADHSFSAIILYVFARGRSAEHPLSKANQAKISHKDAPKEILEVILVARIFMPSEDRVESSMQS